jgi:agmatinase
VEQIGAHAAELVTGGRTVIAIGGDHTIALPMLRGDSGAHRGPPP